MSPKWQVGFTGAVPSESRAIRTEVAGHTHRDKLCDVSPTICSEPRHTEDGRDRDSSYAGRGLKTKSRLDLALGICPKPSENLWPSLMAEP
jgi:hypothetical protein